MGQHTKKKAAPVTSSVSKSSVTVFIVLFFALAAIGYDFYQHNKDYPLKQFPALRSKGDPKSPVRILEFVDFQCPECALGSLLIKATMAQYPNKIHLGVKYFPLSGLNSSISAAYAECASRQNKFWEFQDALMGRQDDWRTLLLIKKYFKDLASELGLDAAKLEQCAQEKSVKSLVEKEKKLGESYSVQMTPTYFINEKMVVGVYSLRKTLDQYLQEKEKKP